MDAPALNVQPPTVAVPMLRLVVAEVSKNAVPVGTVPGLQLAAVLKSPEPGAFSQVASCAAAGSAAKKGATHSAVEASSAARLVEIRRKPDIGTA